MKLDSSDLYSESDMTPDSLPAGFGISAQAQLLTGARRRSLRRNEALFRRGDPGDSAYLIRNGIIKLLVSPTAGEHRIYSLRGANSLVGTLSLIDGLPHTTTAEAMTDAEVLVITRAAYQATMAAHPETSAFVIAMLTRRLRTLTHATHLFTSVPLKARIASALLNIGQMLGKPAGAGSVGVEENIAQADIAMMAGASRESVSRALSTWRMEGLVRANNRFKLILDIGKLTLVTGRDE